MTSHYLRYSLYSFFRLQIQVTLAIFGVAAVVLDVVALAGFSGGNAQSPPLAFAAFFTIAVLWVTYWFGLRIAFSLEARDGQLVWRSGIRSGTIPTQAIISIGSSAWLSGMGVIRTKTKPHLPLANEVLPVLRLSDGRALSSDRGQGGPACTVQRQVQGGLTPRLPRRLS